MIDLLLLLSVDGAFDNSFMMLLFQAAFKGHAECVRRLRSSGAKVDLSAANGDGKSAVDLAEEPETKAELQSWIRASDNRRSSQGGARGDYDKDDYAGSDQEEEDENED